MRSFLARAGVRVAMAVLAIGLIFGVWNLVIFAFGLASYVLPTPQSSVATIYERWSTYGSLTVQTIEETAFGFLIGAALGFLLGVTMSASRAVQRVIYPALITSQAVPIVAIAAPLAFLFGFGFLPKLVIVAWVVFFPVAVNVLDGLAHVDRDLLNLARVMGAKRRRSFVTIQLPATYSPLFSGLKIGATYAVTGAVIGEWVASAQQGLGTYIQEVNGTLDTKGVFGATILLAVIGVATFLLVAAAEVVATPWRTRSTARRGVGSLLVNEKGARRWFGSLPGAASRGSQSPPR